MIAWGSLFPVESPFGGLFEVEPLSECYLLVTMGFLAEVDSGDGPAIAVFGHRHATVGAPRKGDPDREDHPVVPEGEEDLPAGGRASAIGGAGGIVVHRGAEEVRARAVAKGVVDQGEDGVASDEASDEALDELEEDLVHRVGRPSSPGQEAVEGGEVLPGRMLTSRLDHTADRVSSGADDPTADEREEVAEARLSEAALEGIEDAL